MTEKNRRLDVIIPSIHSRDLLLATMVSYNRFANGFDLRFIVVENSDDTSYKDEVLSRFPTCIWLQNPTELKNSEANAAALEVGLKFVDTDCVFLCHFDTLATHIAWMQFIYSKIDEGYSLVGFREDATRIHALHSSGLLVKTEIARAVSLFPVGDEMDVCDSLTKYCRDNNLKYYKCRCTFNDKELREKFDKSLPELNSVDIGCNDEDVPIFMHIGRGFQRINKLYNKQGRTSLETWIALANRIATL